MQAEGHDWMKCFSEEVVAQLDFVLADALWTEQRMRKVIDAAVKFQIAIEINSRYSIPSLTFLRRAKEACVRFSFGSHAQDENIGKLDYSVRMAKELGLTHEDMFMPAPPDQKPILRRS